MLYGIQGFDIYLRYMATCSYMCLALLYNSFFTNRPTFSYLLDRNDRNQSDLEADLFLPSYNPLYQQCSPCNDLCR